MARAWLVLPASTDRRAPASLATTIDAAALGLPVALPVAVDDEPRVQEAARSTPGALVVTEAALRAAHAGRQPVLTVGYDPRRGLIIRDAAGEHVVLPAAITSAWAMVDGGAPAVALLAERIFVVDASTDLSGIASGVKGNDAVGRFAAGLGQLMGRPIDQSLTSPAARGLLRVVPSLVDALEAARLATPPAPPTRAPAPSAAQASSPAPPRAAQVAAVVADDGATYAKKCQKCPAAVHPKDGYTVFEQPMCPKCAHHYTSNHGRRAAILLGGIAIAVLVFFAPTWFFDVIGRIIGAFLVLFVFRAALATGVQYDVDVDQGLGAHRRPVRKAGFFKRWGDLDAKWWGKWLLHRGLYAALGVVAWFVPIGHAMADDDGAAIPDGMPGAIAPHPVTRLKPLVGQATHDGLALELVELKLTDGLVAVFEATRAGKTERFTMDVQTVSSAAPHGVTFWVTDVGVPSEPVYVEVSFVQPPSFWE